MPIVSPFHMGESLLFKKSSLQDEAEAATFVMTKGQSASWIIRGDTLPLANNNQIEKVVATSPANGMEYHGPGSTPLKAAQAADDNGLDNAQNAVSLDRRKSAFDYIYVRSVAGMDDKSEDRKDGPAPLRRSTRVRFPVQ